jgi:hypothetical protein
MHTRAFGNAAAAVASSSLPAFYASSLKALWLIDSATLVLLAVVFALSAARPSLTSSLVLILLGLIPSAMAFFLYTFLGFFLPAHLLLASAGMAVMAGILTGRRPAD